MSPLDIFGGCRNGFIGWAISPYRCPESRRRNRITDAGLRGIARRFRVSSLGLKHCTEITMPGLDRVIKTCRVEPTRLNLRWCGQVTDAWLGMIARNLPNVTSLGFGGYEVSTAGSSRYPKVIRGHSQVTAAGLRMVARGCPKLVDLSLYCCEDVTDSILATLAKYCAGLTVLDLQSCKGFGAAGLAKIAQGCPKLTKLGLGNSHVGAPALAKIAQCPNITELNLEGCKAAKGQVLVTILEGCPNLHPDNLSGPTGDGFLRAIAGARPEITELDVATRDRLNQDDEEHPTDAGIGAIALGCPKLTKVDLSCCEFVTDASLYQLADGCPNIIEIRLPPEATDVGLVHLVSRCRGITHLHINGPGITDAGLEAIALELPGLTVLSGLGAGRTVLNGLGEQSITDAGLTKIGQGCPRLTHLDLGGNTSVTDKGIAEVATSCPDLTNLGLNHCERISDRALLSIAENCPSMTRIDVRFCKSLSVAGQEAFEALYPEGVVCSSPVCDRHNIFWYLAAPGHKNMDPLCRSRERKPPKTFQRTANSIVALSEIASAPLDDDEVIDSDAANDGEDDHRVSLFHF